MFVSRTLQICLAAGGLGASALGASALSASALHAQAQRLPESVASGIGQSGVWDERIAERFSPMLGVGYTRGQQLPPVPSEVRRLRREAALRLAEESRRYESARAGASVPATVQCPMPVRKTDNELMSPMRVAALDSAPSASRTSAGVIIGCVNPLNR